MGTSRRSAPAPGLGWRRSHSPCRCSRCSASPPDCCQRSGSASRRTLPSHCSAGVPTAPSADCRRVLRAVVGIEVADLAPHGQRSRGLGGCRGRRASCRSRVGRQPAQRGGGVPHVGVETPLMVPPVNGSIAHGIRLSSCSERPSAKTPVTRLLRNFGNFLANSAFRL